MTTLPTASQREKQRRGIGLKNIRNKKQNQIDKVIIRSLNILLRFDFNF